MCIRYGSRDRHLRASSHLPTLRFDFFFKLRLYLFVFLYNYKLKIASLFGSCFIDLAVESSAWLLNLVLGCPFESV